MTVSDYKKLVHENAHLEGDELWDAMTQYALDHPDEFPKNSFEEWMKQNSANEMPYKDMGIFIPGEVRQSWWRRLLTFLGFRKPRSIALHFKNLPTTIGSGKPFKKIGTKGKYIVFECGPPTPEEIKAELSKLATDIREVVDGTWATVYATVDSIQLRESSMIMYDGVETAMKDSYHRILFAIKEHKEDPNGDRSKYRQAFNDQWAENIANGIGDARGETIPSREQVLKRLTKQ